MSRAVAIGDARRLGGYALAGVDVLDTPAGTAADVFSGLDREVGLVLLTEEASEELAGPLAERDDLVWVVIPA